MLDRLEKALTERRHTRLAERFGGIQQCTWCRQIAQDKPGWHFSTYSENPMLDVLTCGVCGGTSLWMWGMGMHFVRPLDPPKPLFEASEVTPSPQSRVGGGDP